MMVPVRSFLACLCSVIFLCAPAMGRVPEPSPAEQCLAANEGLSLGAALPRTAGVLKSGGPLRVVAIGSSSTVGLWMTREEDTYPGVMRRELARLVPSLQVEIFNAGRNGDTIPGNIARFDRDVFAHHPDLVIWQIGGNDFTWGEEAASLMQKIASGIALLRAQGIDVILMDQQYTPVILGTQYAKMQSAIATVVREHQVAYLPRFDMLHRAVQSGVSIMSLTSLDGLHMSGEAYDCVGRALARAIVAGVK